MSMPSSRALVAARPTSVPSRSDLPSPRRSRADNRLGMPRPRRPAPAPPPPGSGALRRRAPRRPPASARTPPSARRRRRGPPAGPLPRSSRFAAPASRRSGQARTGAGCGGCASRELGRLPEPEGHRLAGEPSRSTRGPACRSGARRGRPARSPWPRRARMSARSRSGPRPAQPAQQRDRCDPKTPRYTWHSSTTT